MNRIKILPTVYVVKSFAVSAPQILEKIKPGDTVELRAEESAVRVDDTEGNHVGYIPQRYANRILPFITAGCSVSGEVQKNEHKEGFHWITLSAFMEVR